MTISRKHVRESPQIGSIHAHDVSIGITSVAQNDWDQITAFNTNGASKGVVTPDHTNNHIVVGVAGYYQVHFEWSGYGPAVAHDWWLQLAKNNRAGQYGSVTTHFTTPTTQKEDSQSASDIIYINKGDTIELWVQRKTAGTNILLTTIHSVIDLHKVAS